MLTKHQRLIKKVIKQHLQFKYDMLAKKAELKRRIERDTHNGEVAVVLSIYWMVDHVTETRVVKIKPHLTSLQHVLASQDDEAQVRDWQVLDPRDADESYGKRPHYRDHVLEAMEDGHPHVVYC